MNKQFRKTIHKELITALTLVCEKMSGLTLNVKKKHISLQYRDESAIPLTITFDQTPTLLIAEVCTDDGSNRFFLKILKYGASEEKTIPGIDELLIYLLETYVSPEGPLQSKEEATNPPDVVNVKEANLKKITAVNIVSTREVTDVMISCDNEPPISVTLPSSVVDKFHVGALILDYESRVELYDRGANLH